MPAAIIGQNYVLSATFTNADGTPLAVTDPVTYQVFSFDEKFILEGTGMQDNQHPENWYANIVIPEGSPIPQDVNNQQYHIDWYAQRLDDAQRVEMKATQQFQVLEKAEPLSYDSAITLLKGQPLRDNLITTLPIQKYTLTIVDEEDNEYYTYTNDSPESTLYNNCYVTRFSSESALAGVDDKGYGFYPYLLVYEYDTELGTNVEVHTLYVVNGRAMTIVNNLRRSIDKARNFDIDPSLRWTDAELIHFTISGVNRFNVSKPTITYYTIGNFPTHLTYIIEKCAEYECLSALYLAEGMKSFDFTGASVTLNVNRTDYIKTKLDDVNSWLNDNITSAKTLLVRQTQGNGTMGVSLTSVTNGYSRFLNNYTLNRLLARRY